MVQVPAPVRWTVEPLTGQEPPAAKLTARPEEAVALTVKSGSPTSLLGRAANVMVWLALAMLNVCTTSGAALKLASPIWVAVTEHEPAAVIWTVVEPVPLQFPVMRNPTARPEVLEPDTVKSGSPKVLSGRAPNEMVWSAIAMLNDRGTSAAGLKLPLPACDAVMVQEPAPLM